MLSTAVPVNYDLYVSIPFSILLGFDNIHHSSQCIVCRHPISGWLTMFSRLCFQQGEGPRRGLLRALWTPSFPALAPAPAVLCCQHPGRWNSISVVLGRRGFGSCQESGVLTSTKQLNWDEGEWRVRRASLPMFAQSCSTFYIVVSSILCRCVFLCCTLAAVQISPLITNNLLKNYTCKSSKTASLEPVAWHVTRDSVTQCDVWHLRAASAYSVSIIIEMKLTVSPPPHHLPIVLSPTVIVIKSKYSR